MEVPGVRYAHRDGRAIAYQTWGSGGLDYLIISEWNGNADAMWEHPVHLRLWRVHGSLARVVRVDRSGVGSSDPAPDGVAGVESWSEDLLAVLDAEGWQRFAVSGEGWGGHAAIALAVNHPERVDRLVLLNSYPRILQDDGFDGMSDQQVDEVVELIRSYWGTGRVIGGAAPGFGPEYRDFCGRYERLTASPAVAAATVRAAFTSDVRDLLPDVRCPTIVLYSGDYSYIHEAHSRYLVEHIEGAEFLRISGTMYYDLAADLGRRYVGFLTGETDDVWAERELAVVVFSDIVGSTAQLAQRGDREWTELLETCNDAIVHEVRRLGGRVVKQTGDGHLLTFRSPGAALSAVFGMRRVAHALGVSMRFGVHMGEIEVRTDGDIAGMTVHTASRIADRASGDEIVVSRVISDLLAGTGPEFVDLGSQQLKGLPAPLQLFSIRSKDGR